MRCDVSMVRHAVALHVRSAVETGVSGPGRKVTLDLGALNRDIVLENDAVFGSVNANRRHYELAAQALADADRDWLAGLECGARSRSPTTATPSRSARTTSRRS